MRKRLTVVFAVVLCVIGKLGGKLGGAGGTDPIIFAAKLIGRMKKGDLLFGYARLPSHRTRK
jgi:hypothetical protein